MSCPDCFSGHVHQGTPRGEVSTLYGLETYISQPTDTPHRGIIIIIPDAFGWEFVNNRILADDYAEKGRYLVYLPDFMKGITRYYLASVMAQIIPFKYHNSFESSWPIVRDFFASVRENEGSDLPLYAAGFCWGGKHVVNLGFGDDVASNGKSLINAGFTGHPSFLEIPNEIEKINIPVSFALGDKDMVVKPPQIKQIQEVFEKEGKSEMGEVRVYEGAGHGFCVRADLVLSDATKQADEAESQALAWFERHPLA
ncbi:unnamed protein product [Penicillium olsonii]|nr:unnamed protein product [Penicillium olsonii]CAG7927549.1 unnamed protein product [Penicillium olsonii]